MKVEIALTGSNPGYQVLLSVVHRSHQRGKLSPGIAGVGPGDIGCITQGTRSGIDQEARGLARPVTIVVLVMQNACMFVQRDDA